MKAQLGSSIDLINLKKNCFTHIYLTVTLSAILSKINSSKELIDQLDLDSICNLK